MAEPSGSGFHSFFEDHHACIQVYIDYTSTDLAASGGRPRCVELARVLKKTGSFYYHCDWHASHYVKAMQASMGWRMVRKHTELVTIQR